MEFQSLASQHLKQKNAGHLTNDKGLHLVGGGSSLSVIYLRAFHELITRAVFLFIYFYFFIFFADWLAPTSSREERP